MQGDFIKLKIKFKEYTILFEDYLKVTQKIRKKNVPSNLFDAMEYSLNAGGKRLRPILCLSAAEKNGCSIESALPMALGLEMLHTATLIHDDLPCMDNDDLRRGKLSCHKKFGETMAILAGDALLAQSIEFPLNNIKNISSENLLNAMKIFSLAIGPSGVCGGQVLDMFPIQPQKNDYVKKIAELKTGVLIRASVLSGVSLGTLDSKILECYSLYGKHLGSAFQILDDILDVTSSAEELGKTPGKDTEQGKITHVTIYGIDKAKEMAIHESNEAKTALKSILSSDEFLIKLPDYLISRTK
ncbi:MAG: polyprenyl synthetase family protein [Synergistaceae bacterium]